MFPQTSRSNFADMDEPSAIYTRPDKSKAGKQAVTGKTQQNKNQERREKKTQPFEWESDATRDFDMGRGSFEFRCCWGTCTSTGMVYICLRGLISVCPRTNPHETHEAQVWHLRLLMPASPTTTTTGNLHSCTNNFNASSH